MTPRLLIGTFAIAIAAGAAAQNIVGLRIADEAAPAGSIVQLKVQITEPKPISTGRGTIRTSGVSTIHGIVLMNEGQDTYGVATVDGNDLSFNIVSPSSAFGTQSDYPIVGVAGTVANASSGTVFPLQLDGSAFAFRDPSGAVYSMEIQDGHLTVTPGAIAIGDVKPGSAVMPAGGVVHIFGTNFTPTTRVQFGEAAIAQQNFVSSRQIDVVLAQAAHMHGMRIRARNDDKGGVRSESEYFSYERTAPIGASDDALFSKTVPLFAPATFTTATIALPHAASRRRRAAGPARGSGSSSDARFAIALQNLESNTANASIELLDAAGNPYAVNSVSIGPDRHYVRSVGDLFGVVAPPFSMRVHSDVPLHVLGITTDPATGGAAALPPH
jgi:hypothetical protein